MSDQRDRVTELNLYAIDDPLWINSFSAEDLELIGNMTSCGLPQKLFRKFKQRELEAQIQQVFERFDIYEKNVP